MNPSLALLLTYGFVFWLFRRDYKEKPEITGALWLPLIWFLIIATRSPIDWFTIWGVPGFGGGGDKGNLDAIVYISLIIAGTRVLINRGVNLSRFASDNTWLLVLLLYSLLGALWADEIFTAAKRWIKMLGHPVMALILVTEPNPAESVRRLIKRSSYVILPISIMLIKYFPAIGRSGGGGWATELANRGITIGKNQLGANCWILGIFLVWQLIEVWPRPKGKERRNELILILGLLWMIFWLLGKAGSATSTLTFALGIMSIIFMSRRKLNRHLVGIYAVSLIAVIALLEINFEASAKINEFRGKEDTVEGRGRLQEYVLNMDTNPIIGTGFESFWYGSRLSEILARPEFQWRPNQAHNGYIEMYLNLGILGLLFLGAAILEIYFKGKHELIGNIPAGKLRLACLISILVYNWTEAAFKGLSVVYFLLFLIAVTYYRSDEKRIV